MNSLRPLPLLSSRLVLLGSSNGAQTIATGVRHASTKAAITAPTKTKAPAPAKKVKKPSGKEPTPYPPGHGERFWVHNHIVSDFTLYSLTPELRSNKAFPQLVYTGKKLIPAKLRKDYWRPLAVVEFGAGQGDVGRSVFQKLRELRKRHLLEWEDEALLNVSRRDRGKALNDQRGNFVADLAAVLSGVGKGNRVSFWQGGENAEVVETPQKGEGVVEVKREEGRRKFMLHQATVYWANEQDKYYAEEWTENVSHVVGLPEKAPKEGKEVVEAAPEAAKAE